MGRLVWGVTGGGLVWQVALRKQAILSQKFLWAGTRSRRKWTESLQKGRDLGNGHQGAGQVLRRFRGNGPGVGSPAAGSVWLCADDMHSTTCPVLACARSDGVQLCAMFMFPRGQ